MLGLYLAGDLFNLVPDIQEQFGGGDDAVALGSVAEGVQVGPSFQGFPEGGGKG